MIIGRGYSAVLNHVLLRRTDFGQERIHGREVLHIGFDDPWKHYMRHRMGQFPHLLTLPGFQRAFDDEDPDMALDSQSFARETEFEFQWLRREFGDAAPEPLNAWVAVVQPRESQRGQAILEGTIEELTKAGVDASLLRSEYPEDFPPFRLLVVEREPAGPRTSLVYADMVDVCVGSGVPRLLRNDCVEHTIWEQYARPRWESPESYSDLRFVIPGQHALYRNNYPADQKFFRFCVYGWGGIGLNLVETRVELGMVDWMSPSEATPWPEPNTRNNAIFSQLHLKENRALPVSEKLRIGEWIGVQQVTRAGVKFGPAGEGKPAVVRDCRNNMLTIAPGQMFRYSAPDEATGDDWYHQLLIAQGLSTAMEPGTAAFITRLVGSFNQITTDDSRIVGLTSRLANGAVRILGSAALSLRKEIPWGKAEAPTDEYFKSLPSQSRIGGVGGIVGITYNAVAVAYANRYFASPRSNTNVNTASLGELTAILGNPALAAEIYRQRGRTEVGFRNDRELISALPKSVVDSRTRPLLDRLDYSYQTP